MSVEEMEWGHWFFLVGVGLSTIGFIVIIIFLEGPFLKLPSPFGISLAIFAGKASSAAGGVLMLIGIHVFMRSTIETIGGDLGVEERETATERNDPD